MALLATLFEVRRPVHAFADSAFRAGPEQGQQSAGMFLGRVLDSRLPSSTQGSAAIVAMDKRPKWLMSVALPTFVANYCS